jgi:hypothetical protein
MKKNRTGQSGFTLVEVAVGGAVTVIVGVAIAGLQYVITSNQLAVYNGTIKVEYANSGVSSFIHEIRTARNGDNGTYLIELASPSAITFYSDIDGDGKTERVRYYLNGTNLMKGIIKPTGFPATYPSGSEQIKVVSDNVQNGTTPIFTYYNSEWPTDTINNPLATPVNPSLVRMVKIYLRVNTKANDAVHDYILDSSAMIRTIKDNL